jgi:NAD-dependent deacetylase
MEASLQEQIRQVARMLLDAEHALALTGAGVSTASGIPDFRSPGRGLWTRMNPLATMSVRAFQNDPRGFYDRFRDLFTAWVDVEPNAAHRALADLEKWGLLEGVITQNVDDLHQQAGSKRVWEIHGHLRKGICLRCEQTCALASALPEFMATGQVPRCSVCGGVIKPKVILYGETLPRHLFMDVLGQIERCDLLMVAGSSLATAPAGDLPIWALEHGATVVVLNGEETPMDDKADVVVRARVESVLPQVAELCHRYLAGETYLLSPQRPVPAKAPAWRDAAPFPGLSRVPALSVPRLPQVMPAVRRRMPSLDSLREALWHHGTSRTTRLDRFLMTMAAKGRALTRFRRRLAHARTRALGRAHDAAWRLTARWLTEAINDRETGHGEEPKA